MAYQGPPYQKRKQEWVGFGAGNKRFRGDGGPHRDILAAAPRELRILDYVKSHVAEIEHLNKSVERDMTGKSALQRLPRHQQRRAMGHDIKRMPRSVRNYAQVQYANQSDKRKKLSRYHRRRPKNLLQEYTRRQRQHVWLETHIWHAKRFHMVEKWGYKIPLKPTEKSERACYRATSTHCLLQDLSYMSCIEITGDQTAILDGLSHVTNTKTGSTFAAKSCLPGTREGQTMLFQYDRYPYGGIAPVTYMWRPITSSSNQSTTMATGMKQLWVWCHPCCFDEVWQVFKKCLDLAENDAVEATESCRTVAENSPSVDNGTEMENLQKSKTVTKVDSNKNFISDKFKTDCSAVNSDKKITMKSLTGSVLRYRLTGPQSGSVLFDALQQASIVPENLSGKSDAWWKAYYARKEVVQEHAAQRELVRKFSECLSPGELPPCCVVGLTVEDPRLTRPEKRTKIVTRETDISSDVSVCKERLTPDIASSPLWETSIREEVTTSKMSDHAVNKMKSENLLPGTPLHLGDEGPRIPVILIQRPRVSSLSNTNQGRGSGWDILLPKGWGMPFWLSLVFRGARCGGMKEGESMAFEGRTFYFPEEFPDTKAGRSEMEQTEKTAVAKYNRRPPAKRTNYSTYGVTSPFTCPWKALLKEWFGSDEDDHTKVKMSVEQNGIDKEQSANVHIQLNSSSDLEEPKRMELGDPFFVLRDSKCLRRLQNCSELSRSSSKQGNIKIHQDKLRESLKELQTDYQNSLVPVSIDMVQRGSAGQFSVICIPSEEDRQKLDIDKDYGGPLEPRHVDQAQIEKKKMKKEFKEKKINKKIKVDRHMKMLVERDDVKVRNCSRDVIGYLTNGGFSLGSGYGIGKGFVSAKGLVELIQTSGGPDNFKWLVLVRSPSSLQYRFARVTILL